MSVLVHVVGQLDDAVGALAHQTQQFVLIQLKIVPQLLRRGLLGHLERPPPDPGGGVGGAVGREGEAGLS